MVGSPPHDGDDLRTARGIIWALLAAAALYGLALLWALR